MNKTNPGLSLKPGFAFNWPRLPVAAMPMTVTMTMPAAVTMPVAAAPVNLLRLKMRDLALADHSGLRGQFGLRKRTSHLRLRSEQRCSISACRSENTRASSKAESKLQKVTTFHSNFLS